MRARATGTKRFAGLLAAALWVLVYRALRQLPDTADRAGEKR